MSFFSKIEKVFKDIFGSNKWEQTAATALSIVSPLVETMAALIAGEPAAALLQGILTKVQAGLSSVSSLAASVAAGTANSTTAAGEAKGILSGVQSQLQSLLTAGQIKDPATLAKVTAIANTIIEESEAILAALPVGAAPATPAPTA